MVPVYNEAFDLVGNTPSLRLNFPEDRGRPVYVKLEGANPTGSVKDRAARHMLRHALLSESLAPGKVILDASSGNMACSLAYFGHVLGYDTVVVAGSKLTLDKRRFITSFGAELISHGSFTIEGNALCRSMVESDPDRYCFLDQLHNPVNPLSHFETTGPEILRDHPDVSVVVGSLGSGGTLCGVANYLAAHKPDVRLIAVEAVSGSRIPGVGAFVDGDYITPFISEMARSGLVERRIQVSESEAWAGVDLLARAGAFVGPQTGGLFHSLLTWLAADEGDGSIVLISGDTGWTNLAARPLDAPSAGQ